MEKKVCKCVYCDPDGMCNHPVVLTMTGKTACFAKEGRETECRLYSENKPKDMVDKPEHYTRYSLETIDALRGVMSPEEFNGFLKGNAIKYLTRAGAKDSLEQDLHKVLWYAMFLYLSNGGSVESLKKTYDYMKVRFVTV